jgi:hypothetical protein
MTLGLHPFRCTHSRRSACDCGRGPISEARRPTFLEAYHLGGPDIGIQIRWCSAHKGASENQNPTVSQARGQEPGARGSGMAATRGWEPTTDAAPKIARAAQAGDPGTEVD